MRTASNRHQVIARHSTLIVRTLCARTSIGVLEFGWMRFRCALGRTGRTYAKREGDGASPCGAWPVREGYYRSDRVFRPRTSINLRAIKYQDGWCDATADRNYNRRITHPYPASAEHLWREDGLYDIVVVLGYNDAPRIKGRGSAIFLHCARNGYPPTQGCVAIARRDLVRLMANLTPRTRLLIK